MRGSTVYHTISQYQMSHHKSNRSLSPLSEPEDVKETPQYKGIRNRGAYFKAIQARSGRPTNKERQRQSEILRVDTSRLKQMMEGMEQIAAHSRGVEGATVRDQTPHEHPRGIFGTHTKEVSNIPDGFFSTDLRNQTKTNFPDGFFGVTNRTRTVVCEICGNDETEKHAAEHRFQAAKSVCSDLIVIQPATHAEKTVDTHIRDEAEELREELLNQRKIDKVMQVIREEARNQERVKEKS